MSPQPKGYMPSNYPVAPGPRAVEELARRLVDQEARLRRLEGQQAPQVQTRAFVISRVTQPRAGKIKLYKSEIVTDGNKVRVGAPVPDAEIDVGQGSGGGGNTINITQNNPTNLTDTVAVFIGTALRA